MNLENRIELYFQIRDPVGNDCGHIVVSLLAPGTCQIGNGQVNEEKGYRKFGGRPFVHPSARYIGKYAGDCKTNTV